MGGLCWKESAILPERRDLLEIQKQQTASRVGEQDLAICDLKRRKRDCDTYITKMEQKINESREAALKFNKAGDKLKAIFALKLKKMYEETKAKVEGARHLLETTILNVEQARLDADVYGALKQGEEILSNIRARVNVEDFQAIYENQQERQRLTEFLGAGNEDEAEFADQLQHLEDQLAQGPGVAPEAAEVAARFARADVQAPTHEIHLEVNHPAPAPVPASASVPGEEVAKEAVMA